MNKNRKHYLRNRENEIVKAGIRQSKYRRYITRWLANVKEAQGCRFCGESFTEALEFHHVKPSSKSFNIHSARRAKLPIEAIETEVQKCAVLCANCHRKVHACLHLLELNARFFKQLIEAAKKEGFPNEWQSGERADGGVEG